jgi:hypothetical protein
MEAMVPRSTPNDPPHASTVFAMSEHAMVQRVGNTAVILLSDSGQLFTCNASALSFLSKVDGVRNFREIVGLFADEVGTDEDTACTDLSTLVATLLDEAVVSVKR